MTTIAANPEGDDVQYILEVFSSLVQVFNGYVMNYNCESSSQSEELALAVEDSNGVYVVPAFTGLGAPCGTNMQEE